MFSGGTVVSTRCSETYYRKTALVSVFGIPLWYTSNSPRTVIQVNTLAILYENGTELIGSTSVSTDDPHEFHFDVKGRFHITCLEVIKLFSCSTQLSTKFQLLIKTKIQTNEVVS